MSIKKFEDLIAWNKAQDLAVEIYSSFSHLKDFGFRDQIQKAVISISNNISEGFDRSSKADFTRSLFYSIGSSSEVKSMLYLSARLGYLENSKAETLIQKTNEVAKIIRGLIKSLTT